MSKANVFEKLKVTRMGHRYGVKNAKGEEVWQHLFIDMPGALDRARLHAAAPRMYAELKNADALIGLLIESSNLDQMNLERVKFTRRKIGLAIKYVHGKHK